LTTKLLTTYKHQIKELKLVPGGGGCFELSLNGDLIYSKLKTGKFPDEKWAVEAVGARLKH
jgi:selenoprotein W-related protein